VSEPKKLGDILAEGIKISDTEGERTVTFVKNGHRYVFKYKPGEEAKILAGIVEMTEDPKSDLDWLDAAVLSHQLGHR